MLTTVPGIQPASISFVSEQQWASMPGDEKPVAKVADACARLIMQQSE